MTNDLPGGLTRRSLLRAATAGAAVLGLGSAGCTSAVGSRDQPGGSGGRRGGELVVAQAADVLPKNVINQTGMNASWRLGVFDTLVGFDRKTKKVLPRLATSWEASPDGRTTTFTLREGVTWHSGRAFDGEDVKFTLEFLGRSTPPWSFAWLVKRLTSVDVLDKRTVRLGFAEPVNTIFDALSLMVVVDRESAQGLLDGTAVVGTGPFTWGEYQQGTSLRLRRNENYWQPEYPVLDSVLVRVMSAAEARMAALRSGQVHLATAVSPLDLKQIANDDRFRQTRYDTFSSGIYLGGNVRARLLDNRTVRQAIQYTVDRQRINDELYTGQARVSATPWSATSPAYDAESAGAYRRDIGRAKRMLAQAGASGAELILEAPQALSKIGEVVEFNLREAGLRPTLRVLNTAQQDERFNNYSFEGLWIGQHGYNTLSPTNLIYSAAPYRTTQNLFNFSSPRYGQLAEQTLRADSEEDRKASYRELSRFLLDEAFCCDIVHATNTAVSRGVAGWDYTVWDDLVLHDARLD
jgi:peptide/nickel transport system substrate-binding protein